MARDAQREAATRTMVEDTMRVSTVRADGAVILADPAALLRAHIVELYEQIADLRQQLATLAARVP